MIEFIALTVDLIESVGGFLLIVFGAPLLVGGIILTGVNDA